MIFGTIQNAYSWLEAPIRECLAYAQTHALHELEKGTYSIKGDELYYNISHFTTTVEENRFWEAHRCYLDIHYVLEGVEQIAVNFIGNLTETGYDAQTDFVQLEGKANGYVQLQAGDFLVCYPSDAHKTCIQAEQPCAVKKAIFKVKIET